jgi:hypothetical protein
LSNTQIEKDMMADIVHKQDRDVLLNDNTFLGERKVLTSAKTEAGNSLANKIVLGAYYYLHIAHKLGEFDEYPLSRSLDEKKKLVGPQWIEVQRIGNLYVDEYMTDNLAGQPAPWKDQEQDYHCAAFERIVYHWRRVISGTVKPPSICDAAHKNLIPLHLFENHWGAMDILGKAINNRRSSYFAKLSVRTFDIYSKTVF